MSDERRSPDIVARYADRLRDLPEANADLLALADAAPDDPERPAAASPQPKKAEWPLRQAPGADAQGADAQQVRIRKEIAIDLDKLKRLGFVQPDPKEKNILSEEFRIIKRPLIQRAVSGDPSSGRKQNMIMVTSAATQEGKTFVSVNLALSMASERDLHVLLIDTDIYTQSVLSTLGVTATKGLVDLLLDESLQFSDILLHTNIPNLSLLPAGCKHPNATELLSSHRMSHLVHEIASRYHDRIIIVDAPPVLVSTEPSALAAHVGQTVLVVEQHRTRTGQVERCLSLLEDCPQISFVLNKVDSFTSDRDFGSGYGYDASYYAA